jgi:predicted nucleic acid-binding protein
MCIIIDTSAFAPVFVTTSELHVEFEPVLKWITTGKGKVVYGGTKYKGELQRAKKYLRIFNNLKRSGRTVEIDDQKVDHEQQLLESTLAHRDFDDAHLVAIIRASGCKLMCCEDERAHEFIKDGTLYPNPQYASPPKIYRNSSHSSLLCDQNIANICKKA